MKQCEQCFVSCKRLIETYSPRNNYKPLKVCNTCLVGSHVPAYRYHGMEFGLIEAYNDKTKEFCIIFEPHERVHVSLSSTPFVDYVKFSRENIAVVDQPLYAANMYSEHNRVSDSSSHSVHSIDSGPKYWSANLEDNGDNSGGPGLHRPAGRSVGFACNDQPLFEPLNRQQTKRYKVAKSATLYDKYVHWYYAASGRDTYSNQINHDSYKAHALSQPQSHDWNDVEDFNLCYLYMRYGRDWTRIAKAMPGRTSSCVESRLAKIHWQVKDSCFTVKEKTIDVEDRILSLYGLDRESVDAAEFYSIRLVAQIVKGYQPMVESYGSSFGPFIPIKKNMPRMCSRCSLLVPSAQTGSMICQHSNWCWTCCNKLPAPLDISLVHVYHKLEEKMKQTSNTV